MNKKIIYAFILVIVIQVGKAQVFDPTIISDMLETYGSDYETSGTARSIGMGGAMGALGADLGAVEVNPAGLGVFRNSTANLTLGVLSNKNKASMLNSYSESKTYFDLTNAGVAIALGNDADKLRVNLGVNYSFKRLDNQVLFPYNQNYVYSDGVDNYEFNSYEQYQDGYKSRLKFSVATNYEDVLYFGLGLDWHYLQMDKSDIYSDRNLSDNTVGYFNRQATPYYQEANGFGLSVGVIGKLTPEFRLGAAYHSPVWWSDIDKEYKFFDSYFQKDASGNEILQWDIYYGYDNKLKYTTPGKVVLSAAYASNIIDDDNSLAVNFDFINYFNKDYQIKGMPDYRLNNSFVDSYMQDSQEYRAGIEYRYKEFKIRAGYAYVSSPIKENTLEGFSPMTNMDIVTVKNYMVGDKNRFSVGLGYDMGPFFADFAYQFVKTDYHTSFSGAYYNNSEVRNFGPGVEGALNPTFNTVTFGKVENTQNNFVLTLGMRF